MQYMRAHGNTPGPTQRPYLTGAISGLAGFIPSAAVLYFSGASRSIGSGLGVSLWAMFAIDALVLIGAGVLYAWIFKRAANDRAGGWLFGIGFGFLLWMLGPVTLWETFTSRPLALGTAAMGLFAANVIYGLALGLLYPLVHSVVQKRLRDVDEPAKGYGEAGNEK